MLISNINIINWFSLCMIFFVRSNLWNRFWRIFTSTKLHYFWVHSGITYLFSLQTFLSKPIRVIHNVITLSSNRLFKRNKFLIWMYILCLLTLTQIYKPIWKILYCMKWYASWTIEIDGSRLFIVLLRLTMWHSGTLIEFYTKNNKKYRIFHQNVWTI